MPARLRNRIVAPLLVVVGAALFGIGAGGIPQVSAKLDAATAPASQRSVGFVDDERGRCDDERPRAQHF